MDNKNVYIVSAKRTAIGSFGGSLSSKKITHSAATVVRAMLDESSIPAEAVDECITGNILQAGLGQNPSRQIMLEAGIPFDKPAFTINQVCASGMKSIEYGMRLIRNGECDVVLTGGIESMSNAPYILPKARFGMRLGNDEVVDSMIADGLLDAFDGLHMGINAENLAKKYDISRAEQDRLAFESHMRAKKAQDTGRLAEEIIPVEIKTSKGMLKHLHDECIRSTTTIEALSKLKPAFLEKGTVTAGNASNLGDGAAMILLTSEKACKRYNLDPLARIIDCVTVGVDPKEMGIGSPLSIQKLLIKNNLSLHDIDVLEINEAFACIVLVAEKILKFDRDKVNVNGGSIALGHPIGATGARIVVTLAHELKKRNVNKGIAGLCVGGGMGMAMLIDRL